MKKAELRTLYQHKRRELSIEQVRQFSLAIADNLIRLLSDQSFEVLHTFLPIATGNEVDTWRVLESLEEKKKGVTIVLPRIVEGTKELEHFVYNPRIPLLANRWAILEPDPEKSIQVFPQQLDVVLLPLLSFDSLGFRVGYGGGFYDRFLAQCSPNTLKIGLSFFETGPDIDDIDAYDIEMDYCITPSMILKFRAD